MYALSGFPLAGEVPVFQTCPQCSYLRDGSCVVCEPGNPHPGCSRCEGGKPKADPWYRHPLFIGIVTATAVGVISSIVARRVERAIEKQYS
jgi:hypothetical protein